MKLPINPLIKNIAILPFLALLTLSVPFQAEAQSDHYSTAHEMGGDIVSRVDHSDAKAAITTQSESVDLLLMNEMIVMQFTDSFLDQISDEIEGKNESNEASAIGEILRSALSSGIRTMLDHGIGIPLHEISEIYYENGRLMILNMKEEEIFEDLDVDDNQVMEDFTPRDARRFVAEAERHLP